MDQLISEYFRTAFLHLLEKEGRGAQKRLADEQNLNRGYVSSILNGRKPGSEPVRAKIAKHFNMEYDEMLALGRQLLSAKKSSDKNKVEKSTEESGYKKREVIWKKFDLATNESTDELEYTSLKEMASEILDSKTIYSDILSKLIASIHDALEADKRNKDMQSRLKAMESRMNEIENMIKEK